MNDSVLIYKTSCLKLHSEFIQSHTKSKCNLNKKKPQSYKDMGL